VRLLASHLTWDDRDAEREELLVAERATIEDSRRRYPDKHGWWAVERAEALLTLRGASTAGEGLATVLADVFDIADGEAGTPAVRRYAVVTAALLTLAPGRPVDPELRGRLTRKIESWPDHEAARAHAEFIRALLADAESASSEHRVDVWRSLIDAPAGGLLTVWHRQVARCRLALALLDGGHRDAAAALLADIVATAPGEGVARIGRWAAELSARARLAPGSSGADSSHGVVAMLTPRELQVLELIAEGLTNPQIGRRLFISPKTASVHVSAILAKIGAANRAEAAALYAASVSAPTSV
jgi:DNA-binding CsgD family transcriptional regulator